MNRELYVSVTPRETKVALLEDDQLAEVYFERENEYTLAGSIYKGRVTRVLPGMQSAFVEIGLERDAFLYVSDFLELPDEDEDGEFDEVKVSGPALAQANGFVLPQQPPASDAEETEEGVEEESAEGASDPAGEESGESGRRWRGRRRRRGRRGGRERAPEAPGAEAPAEVQAEGEAAEPEAEEESEEHAEPPAAEAPVPAPASVAPPQQNYSTFVLPGESIARYKNGGPPTEEPPSEQTAHEERPERRSPFARFRDRFSRRGGRGERGDRGDRPERYEKPAPLPPGYTPIVLPGESISKYRGVEPATAEAAHAEPEPSARETLAAPPELPHAEASAEPEEGSASVRGPEWQARYVAPAVEQPQPQPETAHAVLPIPDEASDTFEEEVIEQELPPPAPARAEPAPLEAATPSAESEVAHAGLPPAEEQEPAHSEDKPQSGSYVLEGGYVEHELLDDDAEEEAEGEAPYAMPADGYSMHEFEEETLEPSSNGELIGQTVRESGEERAMEEDEYEFAGDEFEESEVLPEETEATEATEDVTEESERPAQQPSTGAPYQRRGGRRFERGSRPGRFERRGRPMRGRSAPRNIPLISELLKEGQEILVQIAKEPLGKKGARITSHIALPGRFLVYMPTVNHIGVSRKISSDEERQRLKRIVASEREDGHGGFIVRTAAAHIKEDELRADIRFLKHLWQEIRGRAEKSKAPALIYHDLNLVERILRDQVTSDFSQIWVDNEQEYERVVRFASRFQPGMVRRIKLYSKDTPLFEEFGIQEEINKALKSKVWLKSGGSIVINQTEALVAIDINTGKYVGRTSRLEDTIVKTNCDAVKEIVRQIRLRDLGGIIVIDFIDMEERKNRQKVMQTLEEALKSDRAPSKVLQFNDFGLVAITRKRVKQSLERTLGSPCPYCTATGFVKSVNTVCNEIYVEMRKVRRHVENDPVTLRVNPEVAKELKNNNGRWIQEIEEMTGHGVLVKSDPAQHQEQFDIQY